jgi:hypothetical protein
MIQSLHIFQKCAVVCRINTGELCGTVLLKQGADLCRVAFTGHIRQYCADILQLQFRFLRGCRFSSLGIIAKLTGEPVGCIVNSGSSTLLGTPVVNGQTRTSAFNRSSSGVSSPKAYRAIAFAVSS